MVLREVTVGRSKNSDIYLDDRCVYASNNHATIYYDGGQIMYRDISSNGTLINNIMVRKRAVPIRRGDIIMIAGRYQLNWNQIDAFFSQPYQPAEPAYNSQQMESPVQQALRSNTISDEELKKWSWGAFSMYPIWGFFNGCWWAFFISVFAGYTFIPNIIFGIYGRRWAWEKRKWPSPQDFVETQKNWDLWGIVSLCISVVSLIISMCLFAIALA